MYKLITRILLLIFPFFLLNIVYLNSREWKTKYGIEKFNDVPSEIDIANLGSSHAVEGLEYNIPELEKFTCFNFGLHQQTLEYDWYIFKKYSKKFKKNSVLLINLSTFETNGLVNENNSSLSRYYLFLERKTFPHLNFKDYLMIKYFPLFTLNNPIEDLGKVFFPKKNSPITQKFYSVENSEESLKMCKYLLDGWKKLFPPSDEGLSNNLKYLSQILEECRRNDIIPILITFPLTKDVNDYLEENNI